MSLVEIRIRLLKARLRVRRLFLEMADLFFNFMYCSFDGIDSRFYFLKNRFGILVEMDRTSYLTQSDDLCNKQKI